MNHQQKPKDRSTRLIRQLVHPLLAYDPRALDFIDLIELEYFGAEACSDFQKNLYNRELREIGQFLLLSLLNYAISKLLRGERERESREL